MNLGLSGAVDSPDIGSSDTHIGGLNHHLRLFLRLFQGSLDAVDRLGEIDHNALFQPPGWGPAGPQDLELPIFHPGTDRTDFRGANVNSRQ